LKLPNGYVMVCENGWDNVKPWIKHDLVCFIYKVMPAVQKTGNHFYNCIIVRWSFWLDYTQVLHHSAFGIETPLIYSVGRWVWIRSTLRNWTAVVETEIDDQTEKEEEVKSQVIQNKAQGGNDGLQHLVLEDTFPLTVN